MEFVPHLARLFLEEGQLKKDSSLGIIEKFVGEVVHMATRMTAVKAHPHSLESGRTSERLSHFGCHV